MAEERSRLPHVIAGALTLALAVWMEFALNLPFIITMGIAVIPLAVFETVFEYLEDHYTSKKPPTTGNRSDVIDR